MSDLWDCVQVGTVCEIVSGQSPPGSSYNKEGRGIPFHQGKKLFGEKFLRAATTWTSSPTRLAKPGDILMSVRAPVGPVNIATEPICIGRGLAVIRPGNEVDRDYLFYFFSLRKDQVNGNVGAVFNSINKKQLSAIKVPVPPRPEQKRIVAILDEAFAAIDRAKEIANQNLANARELFEAYLKCAVKDDQRLWESSCLADVTTKIGSGATPHGGKNSYKAHGISLVRSLNVHDRKFRETDLAYIDQYQADKLANVTLEKDDVLINITGASIARCCVLPNSILPARVNQHVSILRVKPARLTARFLCYFLTSKCQKDTLLSIGSKGGSTRQAITKAQLEAFQVKFPNSIEEQNEICAQLDERSFHIARMAGVASAKLSRFTELRHSILKRAFTGQLTANCPELEALP